MEKLVFMKLQKFERYSFLSVKLAVKIKSKVQQWKLKVKYSSEN